MKNLSLYRPVFIMSPGKVAGAEKVVLTGLLALRKVDLNPLMIIIKETRAPHLTEEFISQLDSSIEYKVVDAKKAIDWQVVSDIKNILSSLNSPYIIHTHGFKALVTTKLVFSKAPHFHTHHGNTGHTFKVKCYEAIAYFMMRFCTHVIAVSKRMEQSLKRELTSQKNISTIDNMLSITNASEIASMRALRKLDTNKIKLIFIGRISPEKGLKDFIKAWSKAKNRDAFHLTVLGEGPDMELCQKLVSSNGLSQNTTFVGFTKKPQDYLFDADLLIMPSHTEGLPMTLIEAACSGLPVLGNDVGAIAQIIIHGKNGELLKIESNEERELKWQKALEEMQGKITAWKTSAQEQSPIFQKQYSTQTWALNTKSLYDSYVAI